MDFNVEVEKAKFREQAPVNDETYKMVGTISHRTRVIFSTFARTLKGRGDLRGSDKEIEMGKLARVVRREVICPLLSSPAAIAGSQAQFDEWHRKAVGSLKAGCPIKWRHGSSLTVGTAQKIVNLHCKDLWVLDLVPEIYSRFFHAIIDKVTLDHLLPLHRGLCWTKIDSYEEYMELQVKLRQIAWRRNTCAIALECWNWNKNNRRKNK